VLTPLQAGIVMGRVNAVVFAVASLKGDLAAITLNPARLKVETKPVPDALGDRLRSSGYASRASAPRDLAAFTAA